MDDVASKLTMADRELGEETLLSIAQQAMIDRIKPVARTLWEILNSSTVRKEKLRNKC